jgi:hypothetical protein
VGACRAQVPTSRRLAVCRPAEPWALRLQSFWIEVPCDNSCHNSWPTWGNHGESRSVTRADASRRGTQTRRSVTCVFVVARGGVEPPTFRFQAERARPEGSSRAESVLRRREFVPCRPATPELVLANPLANWSPAALRPNCRIPFSAGAACCTTAVGVGGGHRPPPP